MAEPSTGVKYSISIDDSELNAAQDRIANSFSQITESAVKEGNAIDSAFRKLGGGIAAIFTVQAAANFTRQIVAVRKEIESLEISFRTLLGNEEKANALLGELREFAVKTPLQLNDLAKSAQTLLSFNVEAEKVMPTLRAIGDISMGDAQKMQSLTLAFAQMSSTGKLMGQDLLQMINAGFNPLTVIAEQTGESVATLTDEMRKGAISAQMVTDAFMAAASEGGKFNGMLEKQSQSVAGAFSNLQGALQDMMNDVGQSFQEPLADALGSLTKLVQNYDKFGGVLASTVATFGAYKAACMAVAAAESVATAMKGGHTIATLALEKAQALLNKTMLANPYVAIAAATAAIVTGIIAYTRRTRDARTEQQKLNDMLEQGAKVKQELKDKTEELTATVADEGKSDLERYQAYRDLQQMYPEYLKNVSQEVFLREKLAGFKQDAPNIIDRNELADMEKSVALMEKYVELTGKRAGLLQQKSNSYRNGDTEAQREKTERQLAEVQREMDAINKEFGGSVAKAAQDAGFMTVEEYSKAMKQAASQRRDEMEKAAFEKLTIEQQIAVTGNSIAETKMQIANIKMEIEKQPFNLQLKFELKQAEDQLDELEGRIDGLKTASNKGTGFSLKAITQEIQKQNKALAAARRSGNQDAADEADKALEAAKKNYELFTGKSYDSVIKDAKDRKEEQKKLNRELAKAEEEYSRTLVKQARESALAREQARIDGMEEGSAKRLAQIDLDYQKELNAVRDYERQLTDELAKIEEARWKAANPDLVRKGETFDYSTVTSDMLSQEQKDAIAAMQNAAAEARNRAVKEAERTKQEMLAEYGDLQTKIQAIRNKYNKLRSEAGDNETAVSNITKRERSEIASLVMEAFSTEEAIGKVAGQVQSLGQAARTALQNNLQKVVDFVGEIKVEKELEKVERRIDKTNLKMAGFGGGKSRSGIADMVKEFAKLNGYSEAFINSLVENDEALAQFVQYVNDMSKETAEPIDNITKAVKNFKKAKDAAKSGKIIDIDNLEYAQQLLEELTRQMADNVMDTADSIARMLQEIGDMTGNDNLSKVGDVMSDIVGNIQAAEAGAQAWGGWWGAIIGGLVDLIPKIIKWVNMGNKEGAEYIEKALSYAEQMASYWQQVYQHENWKAPDWTKAASDLAKYAQEYNKLRRQWDAMDWNIFATDEDYQEVANRLNELSGLISGLSSGVVATGREAFSNYLSMMDEQIDAINRKINEELEKRKPDEGVLAELLAELAKLTQEKIDATLEYAESRIGVSASTLLSDLTDMITEAFDAGKDGIDDFAAYFNKTIRKMIIESVLARVLQDRIEELVKSIAWSVDEGHFEGDNAQNWIDWYSYELQQIAEAGMSALGPVSEILQRLAEIPGAATGATKGIATASQDSIDDLNGRMTVIQAHTASLVQSSALSASNTTAMLSALNGIHSDTSQMRTDLNAMRTDLNAIRNNM